MSFWFSIAIKQWENCLISNSKTMIFGFKCFEKNWTLFKFETSYLFHCKFVLCDLKNYGCTNYRSMIPLLIVNATKQWGKSLISKSKIVIFCLKCFEKTLETSLVWNPISFSLYVHFEWFKKLWVCQLVIYKTSLKSKCN
jgi:hypothetical protein